MKSLRGETYFQGHAASANQLVLFLSRQIFFICIISISQILISYEYPQHIHGYYSQHGQDKFLNENIFNGKDKGFFVEIGAHDGISFSNTYFFEKKLGWAGLCVEPNPNIFNKLQANRNCICLQLCISDLEAQKEYLLCEGYMLEMYSGLLDQYDQRHLERISVEMDTYGGSKQVIWVACCPLKSVLKKHNITHIDFLSIDIEGGEIAALKSIDFSLVTIDVILIENNFNEPLIQNYLEQKGYLFKVRIGKDDIYIRKGYDE